MDMVYSISTYLDDISFLCSFGVINDNNINKRRITINRHRVAYSLQVRLIEPLGLLLRYCFFEKTSFINKVRLSDLTHYFTSLIKNSNVPDFNYQNICMYIANALLEKQSSVFEYKNYYSKQRRMLYTYVTRGSFYGGLNISDNYRFKKNVPVCAVYRLSLCNKKYLFKHASNAKALIY